MTTCEFVLQDSSGSKEDGIEMLAAAYGQLYPSRQPGDNMGKHAKAAEGNFVNLLEHVTTC